MKLYPKIGRYTDEEQAVLSSIENLMETKQIPAEKLRVCNSFDELIELQLELSEYEPHGSDPNELLENVSPTIEETESEHHDDFNREQQEAFSETVDDDSTFEQESVADETNAFDDSELDFISMDYDPFSEEIIERSYNTASKEQIPNQNSDENYDDSEELDLKEAASTPVDNLNPKTKQRAAEQTADAILKGYARIAPMPFKYLAKVDEAKVERMSMAGQIDISIEVEDGMTFDEYMRQTNEQVDEIFTVEQDTLEEIREPLIEVLMEQKMELTPQQRLMMAVISHLFQMLTVALKLRKQNNRILQYQKHITQLHR